MDDEQDPIDENLDLNDLFSSVFGLTESAGGEMAEAAALCLESQGHGLKTELVQQKRFEGQRVVIRRLKVTPEIRSSHNDDQKATYEGAEGVAILVVTELGTARSVSRAKKGGGFDYWFSEDPSLSHALCDPEAGRLEVSGIRNGTESEVQNRLNDKIEQTKKSDADYGQRKTYVVVVEFGTPQTWVEVR